jgi:hypothetical protein
LFQTTYIFEPDREMKKLSLDHTVLFGYSYQDFQRKAVLIMNSLVPNGPTQSQRESRLDLS